MDEQVSFAELIFKGKRFDSQTLPVDVLPELVHYKAIIQKLAGELWKEENPDRRRLPKGFASSFDMKLGEIKAGSAVAALEVPTDNTDYVQYFEKARDQVASLVDSPQNDNFPTVVRRAFQPFGSCLADDETITMKGHTQASSPVYSSSRRLEILRPLDEPLTESRQFCGRIFGQNSDSYTCDIEDEYTNNRYKCVYPASLERILEEVVKRHGIGKSRAQVSGEAFVQNGRVIKIDLKSIEPLDAKAAELVGKMEERLLELSTLPDGWHECGSSRVGAEAIEEAKRLLIPLYYGDIPWPRIYPTVAGGISLEWKYDDWDISVEIDTDGKHVDIHALNLDTDEEFESFLSDRQRCSILIELFDRLARINDLGEN